jgi:hypothetical protein
MAVPGSNEWLQDNHDVWSDHMDLAGIKNGGIIGFKYFGFEGLAQSTKGLPAFEGTKQGDDATLNLLLTPSGRGAFSIRVRLDNPWKGKELGVVGVPATASKETTTCCLSVPDVEGLTGKHAIYLVVEGPEVEEPQQQGRPQFGRRHGPQRPQGLFDLHGIGFSKGAGLKAPEVPQVTITADGKSLSLPATPIYSNNANGYTDATHYQVYAPLKANTQLKATSNNPEVKFQVSPITDGRATVRATYQGKEKIFLIN